MAIKKYIWVLGILLLIAIPIGIYNESIDKTNTEVRDKFIEQINNNELNISSDQEKSNSQDIKETEITAISLFDSMHYKSKTNMIYSPTSLNLALELIYQGIDPDSDTAQVLDKYLGENHTSKNNNFININAKNKDVKVANSVWVEQEYAINNNFKEKVEKTAYISQYDSLDVNNSSNIINEWVKEKTDNMIEDIVSPYDIAETKSVLINSIYFNSEWEKEWDEDGTGGFIDFNYQISDSIPFISTTTDTYVSNEFAEGFVKEYKNGYEFIGILPISEDDFNISDLNIYELIKNRSKEYEVKVDMPVFNIENKLNIKNSLIDTKLNILFNDNKDINIFKSKQGENITLGISDIFQKIKIEVDSKGTKAATVTVVEANDDMVLVEEDNNKYIYLRFDRPFAFVIYDPVSDEIVFLGKIISL